MQENIELNTNNSEKNKNMPNKILIYILIFVLGIAAGWFGHILFFNEDVKNDKVEENEVKEDDKQENKEENEIEEDNKQENEKEDESEIEAEISDEELITTLMSVKNKVETIFYGQNVTEELKEMESNYFTDNGKKEFEKFKTVSNVYCFDSAGCNAPTSIFNATGHIYGDPFIYLRTNDTVVLAIPVAHPDIGKLVYTETYYTTFKKENNVWKIDKLINNEY